MLTSRGFTDVMRARFAREIRGLKIVTTHAAVHRKYRVVALTRRSAAFQSYDNIHLLFSLHNCTNHLALRA